MLKFGNGLKISLEVPHKRHDNISMMNKKEYITYGDKKLDEMMNKEDKYLMIADVEDKLSELYWEYRDDLNDEGALRLDEELKYFRNNIINILEKYPA